MSTEAQRFIYENIDSIGLLEALLFLSSDPSKPWTCSALARELRNNPNSVANYLERLTAMKLVRQLPPGEEFVFDESSELKGVVGELAGLYKMQRHKLIELIYSPLKKARDFSEAFLLPSQKGKKEEDNG